MDVARAAEPPSEIVLGLAAALLPAAPAPAQDNAVIAVDLNRTEQIDEACRITFTARNGTAASLEALVYEIVLFGGDGGVEAMTLFDFGELPQGHLRVRQFDIAGAECAELGGILLNGVATCRSGGAEAETCLGATRLGSRTGIEVLQ